MNTMNTSEMVGNSKVKLLASKTKIVTVCGSNTNYAGANYRGVLYQVPAGKKGIIKGITINTHLTDSGSVVLYRSTGAPVQAGSGSLPSGGVSLVTFEPNGAVLKAFGPVAARPECPFEMACDIEIPASNYLCAYGDAASKGVVITLFIQEE